MLLFYLILLKSYLALLEKVAFHLKYLEFPKASKRFNFLNFWFGKRFEVFDLWVESFSIFSYFVGRSFGVGVVCWLVFI